MCAARARSSWPAALALSGLVTVAPLAAVADSGSTPHYADTIGGPGHATIYTSGLDVSTVDNTIVAADTGNDQVVKYSRTGRQIWRVGSSGTGVNHFGNPRDIGVDRAGDIYVADDANSSIEKLSPSGRFLDIWSGSAKGFGAPIGITVATFRGQQAVLAANAPGRKLVILSLTGTPLATIGSNGRCDLSHIRDADIDSAGNVWIADYNNHRIAKFSSSGTCLALYGGLGSDNSHFKYPYGVSVGVDPGRGNREVVFVADSANTRIQEIGLDGSYIATMGVKGDPDQPLTLRSLRRVVQDPETKHVWASDLWGFRVEEFVEQAGGSWRPVQQIPSPPDLPPATSSAVFNEPRGLDFSGGLVTVMDTVNQRFEQFETSNGNLVKTCGERGRFSGGDNWPRGLAIDPATGDVWVADTKDSRINVIDPSVSDPRKNTCKVVATLGGAQGAGAGQFDYPYAITIRGSDRIAFVADTKNNRIVTWSVARKAPIASLGGFHDPSGINVAPNGRVFVADAKADRVVEVADSSGRSLRIVKTYTGGFNDPEGVAVDAAGRIYVADTGHNRVVILSASGATLGSITTAGGKALNQPAAVGVDSHGVLYVSDTQNDRVVTFHW